MIVTEEIIEALGVSRAALDEIIGILGRMPTEEELSTLLAMWESNGRQQSLYGWLKGQHHTVETHDYLYDGSDTQHREIREPQIRDCIAYAKTLAKSNNDDDVNDDDDVNNDDNTLRYAGAASAPKSHAMLLYMVGKVSTAFLDSEYARTCLHLTSQPQQYASHDEEQAYIEMILEALTANQVIALRGPVSRGGLFSALLTLSSTSPSGCRLQSSSPSPSGFDILTCREVRLDAFLFGEEPGRYVVALDESQDDLFLHKLDEARVDACFLGRTTKGRILIDGYDFGPTTDFL